MVTLFRKDPVSMTMFEGERQGREHTMSHALRIIAGAALVLAVSLSSAPVRAQEPASLLLLIDANSIASGRPAGLMAGDINDPIAAVGVRDGLPYFVRNTEQVLTLASGQNGVAGWFTLTSVPDTWVAADSDTDGLSNFVFAGPGLGSPDQLPSRVTLLGDAGIAPLGAAHVAALVGRTVCSVVYQGTLTPHPTNADLAGATLGLVAFRINAVGAGSDPFPDVEVEVLDTVQLCHGSLALPDVSPAP